MLAGNVINIIARLELYRNDPTVRPPGSTLISKILLWMA